MIRKNNSVKLKILDFIIEINFGENEWSLKESFLSDFYSLWGQFEIKKTKFGIDYKVDYLTHKSINLIDVKRESKEMWWKIWVEDQRQIEVLVDLGIGGFNFLLRHILLKLIFANNGLAFHASTVVKNGLALVFLAPSGGGKSTTAGMLESQGYKHLGDDVIFFRKNGSKWFVYGTPLVEKKYKPIKFVGEKVKFFFIEKSQGFALKKLESSLALKSLLPQVLTFDRLDKNIFENVRDFTVDHQFYKLKTRLDAVGLEGVLHEVE